MEIEVKGHSGCQIDVVSEGNELYVYKSTSDPEYINRLVVQAEKQLAAGKIEYQHIRVPGIFDIRRTPDTTAVKMQYIYSKNFIDFFEQAGFEQVNYFIGALKYFIDYEVSRCSVQSVSVKIFQDKFADVSDKVKANTLISGDTRIVRIMADAGRVFSTMEDISIPVGICHGDLTFSNILFNGNNYYLIDFLDSFIETPLQDIVKIRQDTAFRWSQLMYTKRYDKTRLNIVCNKIDEEIDGYFSSKYGWYRKWYQTMQLMNILRILPYAHEKEVLEYLKDILERILEAINNPVEKPQASIFPSLESASGGRCLIVPVAADKPEYRDGLPYLFERDKDGIIICVKSILGLDLKRLDRIYFTVLKKHDDRFLISDLLRQQFKRLGISNAKVVILDKPTQDQAETIFETIRKEKIFGSFFVKDADSYFTTELVDGNGIAVCRIENLDVLIPKDKSYVAVDDMYYVTNTIEKSVIGPYISAGGYVIDDAALFCQYYERLRPLGKLYLSHIIYAMLLDKNTFRPMLVGDYRDWGTAKDLKVSQK